MRNVWLRSLLLMLLPVSIGLAQNSNTTTTTLSSSSQSLQLPGSVTLTATVKPSKGAAGMPSGAVKFASNGTGSVGTATLKAIPSTQGFVSAGISNPEVGQAPYGLLTFPSGVGNYSVLGMLDYVEDATSENIYPQLTIYSGKGSGLYNSATPYPMTTSTINDTNVNTFAKGDFNHDGILDVLIHGSGSGFNFEGGQYYVLPGKAAAVFDPTKGVTTVDTSGITCSCDDPSEAIAVDDFNGDGYADVAYTIPGSSANYQMGVALNGGAGAPASFTSFTNFAPIIQDQLTFHSSGIASGHFTSSGLSDVALVGSFPNTTSAGYVALYVNQGVIKGALTFAAPVLVSVGQQPGSIATADFRGNGMTDVVVTNAVGEQSGSVQVLFGDGKGNLKSSSTIAIAAALASVSVTDFNTDGYPDILAVGYDGSLNLLLNDGTGRFGPPVAVPSLFEDQFTTAIGDFNGDGLADIAALPPEYDYPAYSTITTFLNSASSQAVLVTPAMTLPAGTDLVSAAFPGDSNLTNSTSERVPITVTQTPASLTWAQPDVMEYGAALSATQLDATSSVTGAISYAPGAGIVLPVGASSVTATFTPTDTFDYTGATASKTITVAAPTITGLSPSTGKLGDAATTITVSGQGLVNGALVRWNGTALSTTWVSLNQLTAVIPASLLTSTGTGKITVVDPNNVAVGGSQDFAVAANPAKVTVSAQASVEAGQDGSLTLTVSSYPAPITATVTLAFTPKSPITIVDPAVLFANGSTTTVVQIPANSAAPIPDIEFATGSTAGTITVTVTLAASGVDVTPAGLDPVTVDIPATAPVISSVTLTRNGETMLVSISGLSSTRDMTSAAFHFTAADGASLKTTDLTVDLTTAFTTWYQSSPSDAFGTTFLYTQAFALSSDAKDVGSVTVTLTNSQGASQSATAQ